MPDLAEVKPDAWGFDEDDLEGDAWGADFVPLSVEQARQWRLRHPPACLWCVTVAQLLVGVGFALLLAVLGGRLALGWSAAYGALAVIVPTVFFLYRTRRLVPHAGTAVLNLVASELLKILWIVILLVLAPRLVPSLSWPALMAGMLAMIAVYGCLPLFAHVGRGGKEGG